MKRTQRCSLWLFQSIHSHRISDRSFLILLSPILPIHLPKIHFLSGFPIKFLTLVKQDKIRTVISFESKIWTKTKSRTKCFTFTSTPSFPFNRNPFNQPELQTRKQRTYNVTKRRFREIIAAVEKHYALHNLSVCVFVALGIQQAMRMRHIVFLWTAPLYSIFLHYLIRVRFSGLEKKSSEPKMCVSSLSTNFVWNIYHSAKNWARNDRKCTRSSCKVPFIVVRF